MTDTGSEQAPDQYERFRDMPLEEIREHLATLDQTVISVQKHYAGALGRRRRNLQDGDMAQLNDVIGDLLPMSHNTGVQAEILACRTPEEAAATAFQQIGVLSSDVMGFMARFDNTGVTVLQGDTTFLD